MIIYGLHGLSVQASESSGRQKSLPRPEPSRKLCKCLQSIVALGIGHFSATRKDVKFQGLNHFVHHSFPGFHHD